MFGGPVHCLKCSKPKATQTVCVYSADRHTHVLLLHNIAFDIYCLSAGWIHHVRRQSMRKSSCCWVSLLLSHHRIEESLLLFLIIHPHIYNSISWKTLLMNSIVVWQRIGEVLSTLFLSLPRVFLFLHLNAGWGIDEGATFSIAKCWKGVDVIIFGLFCSSTKLLGKQDKALRSPVSFCSFFKTPKLSIEIKIDAIINACLKKLRCRLCENTHVLHRPGKNWLLLVKPSLQWNSYYIHFIAPKLMSCDHWKCCSNDRYQGTTYVL